MSKIKQDIDQEAGIKGRPEDYPVPPTDEKLLFYIQRNQNKNTVVYELNKNSLGTIDQQFPMHLHWIRYTEGGEIAELNAIQNKLAYGYESSMINPHSFEFNFVSYKNLKFYLAKPLGDRFQAICKINGQMSILDNIYVYAEEFGVFPIVKYIEIYGRNLKTNLSNYQKIIVET